MSNLYTIARDAWEKCDPADCFHPTPQEDELRRAADLADLALGERMDVDIQRYREGLISAFDLANLLVLLILKE